MHQRTPWMKNAKGSSLSSDRIQASHGNRQQSASHFTKGKAKHEDSVTKSEQIQRLEFLRNAVQTSTGQDRDPKGGCFCQARKHALSSHTPICRTCGLILCAINQPYHACPHCTTLLLTSVVRISLEERLDRLISDTLKKEAEQRQRAIEEAHDAAGAFPTLPGTSAPQTNTGQTRPSNQAHKVLSLNSKKKGMTLSSYKPIAPPPSRSHTALEADIEFRVPPPPVEVSYARSKPNPNRPWARIEGGNACYIPASRIDIDEGCSKNPGEAQRRGKAKAKDKEKGVEVVSERSEATKPST